MGPDGAAAAADEAEVEGCSEVDWCAELAVLGVAL